MFRTYFKFVIRNLVKYPGFSFLNIAGLALGIAASFVILMYVWQELRTDRHFTNHERIYRIGTDFFDMGGFAKSQQLLHERLKEYKDVELATIFNRGYQEIPIEVNNTAFREPLYFRVDSNFFRIFSFRFLEGTAQQSMRSPDEVILSEKLAKKYFGNEPAYGKVVRLGTEKKEYKVSGVVANDHSKTHLDAEMWMPVYSLLKQDAQWTSASFYNYVKLQKGADQKDLERNTNDILKRYVYPATGSSVSFDKWKADPKSTRFFIQPLKDIYLYSDYKFEVSAGGNPTQVYVLGIIGLFIILIAAVNYVNLTTARASVRAKEVGIKKTLGAGRKSLILQFLSETVYISILAMLLAALIAEGLITLFAGITGTQLVNSSLLEPGQLLVLVGFVIFIGILAGLYPAFYLTAFRPKKILKGDLTIKGNKHFRSALVVFQFSLAIALIICTLVVYKQLQFMQDTDKGFDEQGVLIVGNAGKLEKSAETFRQAINTRSEVVATSFNQRTPAGKSIWMYTYQTAEMKETITLQTFPVDENYLPALGMQLVKGRNFSKDLASDSSAAIINEAAVKTLGLKEPIGAEINKGQRVIGVVSDFNFQSLREKIAPVVLSYSKTGYQLAIKIRGRQNVASFLDFLQTEWKKYESEEPIQFSFLDEDFATLAEKERVLSKAVTFFTMLALIIAAIGLFALATFTVEQRTREIGIRKVLGANIGSIMTLLSKDLVKLVLIAALISFPLAWWAMNNWLQDFAYRITISWWIFFVAGIIALLIALLTIGFQAGKAAIANPVKSLRTE